MKLRPLSGSDTNSFEPVLYFLWVREIGAQQGVPNRSSPRSACEYSPKYRTRNTRRKLQKFEETIIAQPDVFGPQEVANIVWAMARLKTDAFSPSPRLLVSLCHAIVNKLEMFNPQNLITALYGFSRYGLFGCERRQSWLNFLLSLHAHSADPPTRPLAKLARFLFAGSTKRVVPSSARRVA